MALRSKKGKKTEAPTKTTTPKTPDPLEAVQDEAHWEETQHDTHEPAPQETPEPVPQPTPETKAVAKKTQAAAPARPADLSAMTLPLDEFANRFPPVEFGTLDRIKASQGVAMDQDGGELGSEFVLQLLSFNDSYVISPNENSADSKLCKFSYDNQVLNDGSGTTVEDHLESLREMGYSEACSKRYVELIGMLEDAEMDHPSIGSMVQVSLSPTSVKAFDKYKLDLVGKVMTAKTRGEEFDLTAASRILVTVQKKSWSGNNFSCFSFSMAE